MRSDIGVGLEVADTTARIVFSNVDDIESVVNFCRDPSLQSAGVILIAVLGVTVLRSPHGDAGTTGPTPKGDKLPSNSGPPPNKFSPDEQRIADYLEKNTGTKPIPNPLEGVQGAGRQGDAIIAGITHEFKTLSPGATANTVKNVVNNSIKGGGQARNIVIDARCSGLTKEAAEQGLNKAFGISRGKIDNISIIGDSFFVNRSAQ